MHTPRNAIVAGICLLPEERKKDGVVPNRSMASDIALPCFGRFSRLGLIHRGKLRREATDRMRRLNVRPSDVGRRIGQFSGGNQQNAIVGRWLAADVDILLFDEPTRGIDIGAKSEIYWLIERRAARGKAIVVVSSELPKILRVSDRVAVMREGELAGILDGDEFSEGAFAALAVPQSRRPGPAPAAPEHWAR